MSPLIEEDYLTPREVARLLRRSLMTLYTWRNHGKGPPYVKVEGSVLYPRGALEAFLQENYSAKQDYSEGSSTVIEAPEYRQDEHS